MSSPTVSSTDIVAGSPVPPDALAEAGGLRLDRVVELRPGHGASALANVPNTLPVFDTHFQRFPVLPGVLMLHGMANLADLLLGRDGGRWRLTGARRVQFRHYVRPGDQLHVAVDIRELDGTAARLTGRITRAGAVVVLARELTMTRDAGPEREIS